jgi:hypothetical protein
VAHTTGDGISYPDITVANNLTHYWAFWVICAVYASRIGSDLGWFGVSSDEYLRQQKRITAKTNLILKSVEYLTRDDMKLFGPTSLCLPAKVAYEHVQQSGDPESTALCNNAIRYIAKKGLSYLNAFIQADFMVLRPLLQMHPESAERNQEQNDPAILPHKTFSDPVDI